MLGNEKASTIHTISQAPSTESLAGKMIKTNPNQSLSTASAADFLSAYRDGCDLMVTNMPICNMLGPELSPPNVCAHCNGSGKVKARFTLYAANDIALAYTDCLQPCPECRGVGMTK
jgi:DnaJ-class molecular chaperone